MDPVFFVAFIGMVVFFMLFLGGRFKPIKLIGKMTVRLMIGALALFFLNAFGSAFGYHLPINSVTVVVSGALGIPGILMLVATDLFILP